MSPRLLVMLMIGLSSLQVAAASKSAAADKRTAQKHAADKRVGAKAPTDWLKVELVGDADDDVARLYREQLLAWYRTSGAMDERELAALPGADYFAFRPDLTSFSIDSGESAGQWTFSPPDAGRGLRTRATPCGAPTSRVMAPAPTFPARPLPTR